MTTGAPTREPAIFEIKSANLPLVSLVLKSTDVEEVAREFELRFSKTPDFFDHEPLVIDVTQLPAGTDSLDLLRLLMLLRQNRLSPVALRGGSPTLVSMARAAGLAPAPVVSPATAPSIGPASASPVQSPSPSVDAGRSADANRESRQARAAPAEPSEPATATTALVIDKPVRSGQRIYARDSDLVIMAVVNSGAEVAADGNIHVYAPLRGRALAGARGNTEARILTLCMEPELIAIAGIYRTSEKPLPQDVIGRPTEVRLEGEKLLIKPLRT